MFDRRWRRRSFLKPSRYKYNPRVSQKLSLGQYPLSRRRLTERKTERGRVTVLARGRSVGGPFHLRSPKVMRLPFEGCCHQALLTLHPATGGTVP
jgi:hypothetical protein